MKPTGRSCCDAQCNPLSALSRGIRRLISVPLEATSNVMLFLTSFSGVIFGALLQRVTSKPYQPTNQRRPADHPPLFCNYCTVQSSIAQPALHSVGVVVKLLLFQASPYRALDKNEAQSIHRVLMRLNFQRYVSAIRCRGITCRWLWKDSVTFWRESKHAFPLTSFREASFVLLHISFSCGICSCDLVKAYFSLFCLYRVESNPIQSDPIKMSEYTDVDQELAHEMVVEMLAHQFAYPVKW